MNEVGFVLVAGGVFLVLVPQLVLLLATRRRPLDAECVPTYGIDSI
jgi:hypothetical protein